MPDLLATGRQAMRRHDWGEGLTALSAVDNDTGLSPDDLILLGDALWWTGQPDEAVETFERAFGRLLDEGRKADAATVAALLAYFAMRRMAVSVAGGWMARVEHLLEGQPESLGHAWLEILRLAKALFVDDDVGDAIALADEAIELSRRHGGYGAQSMAMSFKGIAMIEKGDWREGIRQMDAAAAVAMSQEDDLRATSDVYCNTIAACRNLADYRRAGEWTDEAERWMKAHSVGGYPGVCQVHRAELKRLRGSWPEAEEEARRACTELERFHLIDAVGFAHYEIAEVRRRMGDLEAAEKTFLTAYEHGHSAQPGYALLLRDLGRVDEAARAIAGALERAQPADGASASAMARGRLLPAHVEIALTAGDLETARKAAAELEQIANLFEGAAWEATALTCRGSVDLSDGRPDEAIEALERAWRLWQEIELPYEAAQARTLLGRARRATGDETGAMLEFRSARSAFEHLGAASDLRSLGDLGVTDAARTGEPDRRRVTKTFVFTDIVTSTDLIGLIGDAGWEDLLKWHDRVLREEFEGNGGQVIRHTGDGFFVTFEAPGEAIRCAVAIQRRLAAHRREHGFAPWVRIGMHVAEATRQGSDYSGQGVHAAARIGALAQREEIVASSEVLEAAGAIPFPTSDGRTVTLKGITDPVQVHSIDWH